MVANAHQLHMVEDTSVCMLASSSICRHDVCSSWESHSYLSFVQLAEFCTQ